MKNLDTCFLFLILLVFGCQNEQSKPDLESLNIELMRGDIVLCGGKQFGEVSFALGYDNSIRDTFNLAVSLLHSFEYADAEKAFVKVIDIDPNRFNGLYGAAVAANDVGDLEKAKLYFEQLLLLANNIESDRPELKEAKKYY